MFCQNCGNQLDDNAKFCSRCGNQVVMLPPTGQTNEVQSGDAVSNEEKKKNNMKTGIIAGAAVAFLLLVVLIVALVPKKGSTDTAQTIEETMDNGKKEAEWDDYEEDAQGNLLKGIKYDEEGNVIEQCEWEYDEEGNVSMERKYSYLEDCNPAGYCEYDGSGNLLKEAKYIYTDFGKIDKFQEYAPNGNMIKELSHDGEGNITIWTEWEYDAAGNIVKIVSCAPDGTVGGWIEYAYDNNGRRIKDVLYNGSGYIDTWKEWQYDSQGNMTKEERYNNDGILIEWDTYKYDERGNCLEKIYYNIDGTVAEWYSWAYDKDGNRIKETIHHLDGSLDMRYEYDAEGNQIRVIDYDEQLTPSQQGAANGAQGTTNASNISQTANGGNNNQQTVNQFAAQKYQEIVNKYEKENSGAWKYNLVEFTDDNIPELLVEKSDSCILNLYTFNNGNVYHLMDNWSYGTWGRAYSYAPRKGIIEEPSYYYDYSGYEDGYFGLSFSSTFYGIENNQLECICTLSSEVLANEETGEEVGEYTYYVDDNEVTEEQYNAVANSKNYDFQMLRGIYSVDEIYKQLEQFKTK